MVTQRVRKLLQVAERTWMFRAYTTGTNVHPNFSKRSSTFSTNTNVPSRNIVIPIVGSPKWKKIPANQDKMTSRSCSTESDDNPREDQLSENTQARNVLMKSRGTNSNDFAIPLAPTVKLSEDEIEQILSKNWQNSSIDEILQDFEKLASTARLGGEIPDETKLGNILQDLSNKFDALDDEKLCFVFQCLSLWNPSIVDKESVFQNFWQKLDNECQNRLSRWSIAEMLLICDYWYSIRLARKATFVMDVLKKLGRKPKQLSPEQFLHFIFVMNTCRKPPINMYEIEYAFDGILEKFTVNELGIVAMAFFKCQTPLSDDKILTRIHKKILMSTEEMEDFAISAIMKLTRYSTDLRELDTFQNLLHKLESLVPRLSIPCLTHITHAKAFVQCLNPPLMATMIGRLEKNIDLARIKDLERWCWALNVFGYDPKITVFSKIIDSLRNPKRKMELAKYPKVLPTLLVHLSYSNIFPIDLIKQCFDSHFLRRVYNDNPYNISSEYAVLENNIRLDMPKYDGPFLQPHILAFLTKKWVAAGINKGAKFRYAHNFPLDVMHICKLILKSNKPMVLVDHVLPHYAKPDLILCIDEANEAVDPQPILSKIQSGTVKYVPTEAKNYKWFAIVLGTQNQMIRGTNKYVGLLKCKVRQLEKIGYTPIVINFHEWRTLSSNEKRNHLTRRLDYMVGNEVSSAVA